MGQTGEGRGQSKTAGWGRCRSFAQSPSLLHRLAALAALGAFLHPLGPIGLAAALAAAVVAAVGVSRALGEAAARQAALPPRALGVASSRWLPAGLSLSGLLGSPAVSFDVHYTAAHPSARAASGLPPTAPDGVPFAGPGDAPFSTTPIAVAPRVGLDLVSQSPRAPNLVRCPPFPRRSPPPRVRAHLWHGFGANLSSWAPSQRRLADGLGGTVSAHDAPGLGLTERPTGRHAARCMTSRADARLGLACAEASRQTGADGSIPDPDGLVLVGHSMGAVAAALALLEGEEGKEGLEGDGRTPVTPPTIRALVLVAPALVAPRVGSPGAAPARESVGGSGDCPPWDPSSDLGPRLAEQVVVSSALVAPVEPGALDTTARSPAQRAEAVAAALAAGGAGARALRFLSTSLHSRAALASPAGAPLTTLAFAGAVAAGAALWLTGHFVLPLLWPLAAPFLRRAVRNRGFWVAGLASAWGPGPPPSSADALLDASPLSRGVIVPPALVEGYRRPSAAIGWEDGLVRFARARISGGATLREAITSALLERRSPLVRRLARAAASRGVPILIVSGELDAIVPASNSVTLAAALAADGAATHLALVTGAGHSPHEEYPDLFARLVSSFVVQTGRVGGAFRAVGPRDPGVARGGEEGGGGGGLGGSSGSGPTPPADPDAFAPLASRAGPVSESLSTTMRRVGWSVDGMSGGGVAGCPSSGSGSPGPHGSGSESIALRGPGLDAEMRGVFLDTVESRRPSIAGPAARRRKRRARRRRRQARLAHARRAISGAKAGIRLRLARLGRLLGFGLGGLGGPGSRF